jgi:lipopolysaccharide transport system ATP-binding protein
MDKSLAIKVENVWKRYYLSTESQPNSLKAAIFNRFNYLSKRKEFYALQGVNLEIKRGKTFGIIGNNGAGKSTLLRLISGLSRPTKGKLTVRGRVGSLLELGAGFNREFTGRENVIIGSVLAGLTRKEAEAHLHKVVEFAELEDFIDSPLRTYSSGMYVRLAFSIEINLDPDVLILDEVLAVGDIAFQKKCRNHLLEMKEKDKTMLIVSHSMDQVLTLCDEVAWLENGKLRAQGEASEIVSQYKNRLFDNTEQAGELGQTVETSTFQTKIVKNGKKSAPKAEFRTGTLEATVESAMLLNELGQPITNLVSGDPLIVHINYLAHQPLEDPIIMVTLRDDKGTIVYEVGTQEEGVSLGTLEGHGSLNLTFTSLPLMRGTYHVSVGIHEHNWDRIFDYQHNLCELHVEGNTPGKGVFLPSHRWQN